MQEKRQSTRIGIALKTRIIAPKYNLNYEGNSLNISGGGIMLLLERRLPIGTQVELEIFLPKENFPLKTKGKIVWLRSISEENKETLIFEKIYCGMEFIEFTQIAHEDHSKLLNFLHDAINTIEQ